MVPMKRGMNKIKQEFLGLNSSQGKQAVLASDTQFDLGRRLLGAEVF